MLRALSRSGFAVLLGLAIIVPLLNYYRVAPSPTLYSEAAAGVFFLLAIAAGAPLLQDSQRVYASLFAFALGLLAILAYQVVSGRYYEYALSWSAWGGFLLMFLAAAVLGQLVSGVADLRSLVVDRLTHALVFAALLNAIAQAAQATGWALQIQPFAFMPSAEVFASYACSPAGNVAQVNHANTLAWLGISSLIYLVATKRAGELIGAVGIAVLLLSSAFTSSRMAWLMVVATICMLLVAGHGFGWTRRRSAFIGVALFCGLIGATTLKSLITGPGCVTALDRALAAGSVGDYWVRIDLMRQALMVWWSAPVLGVGVGKFMATTFALEPRRDIFQPLDFFPHNALLEMLASFGVAGAALLVSAGSVWIARAWRNRASSPQQWPMLAGIVILLIHAMLEMPLWYLYFLIPFGLMLGIALGPARSDERSVALPWRPVFVGTALLGILGFAYALADHARAERIIWLGELAQNEPSLSGNAIGAIASDAHDLRIFAIAGERELLRFAEINRANAPSLAAVNQRLLMNIPDPVTIARHVMLEFMAGRSENARDLLRRMMMFYPRYYEAVAAEIRSRAERLPNEYPGLARMVDEEMARPPKRRGQN